MSTKLIFARSVYLLFLIIIQTVFGAGVTNMVFHPTNTVYGDATNQKIIIRGTYNNTIWSSLNITEQTTAKGILGNMNDRLEFARYCYNKVYVCSRNIPSISVELASSRTAKIFHDNIDRFKAGSTINKMDDPIDFVGSSCEKVFTTQPATSANLNVTHTHVFTYHHPVLFIDPFGYSSFNYLMKESDDQNEDESTPIRFCEGHEYNGKLYSLGKKPVCPDMHDRDAGTHTKGRITMYKENVVSVVHTVYWCTKTKTHLSSGTRFFGSKWDNRPTVQRHEAPSEDACWEWIKTKRSSWMGELKKVEEGSWATNNDKTYKYPWCGSSSRDVYDAYLIKSKLTVLMPSLEIQTAFGKIPTNKLYDKTHVIGNKGRLVWEPFNHTDTCTHVPYASADGEAIRYDHKQFMNERSRTPTVTHTTYFLSNALKLFEAVDSTHELLPTVHFKRACHIPLSFKWKHQNFIFD